MADQLVTVGVPTYNRPTGLYTTLRCMVEQSYSNLEILVSDNNSTNPAVEKVLKEFEACDKRIAVTRQPVNIGPFPNFRYLLNCAHGDFFMWAADDDQWDLDYIASLVDVLQSESHTTVAAAMEAQYFLDDGTQCEFFPEGSPFYKFSSDSPEIRLQHMLRYAYGNLFYGLFRLKTIRSLKPILEENEIPFFLQVASLGNWRVIPRVGLYKLTTQATYLEARWERIGGFKSPRAIKPTNMLATVDYHIRAERLIRSALFSFDLDGRITKRLSRRSRWILMRHMVELFCGVKFRHG